MDNNNKAIMEKLQQSWTNNVEFGKTRYAKYLDMARSAFTESTGKDLSLTTQYNLVRTYKNLEEDFTSLFGRDKVNKAIFESTTSPDAVGKFINYAFGLATALIPNNVMEKFTSIQTMDKRVGEVFYMDVVKANTKGTNTAGDPYMSSVFGPKTGADYTNNVIDVEEVATGDGVTATVSFTLMWKPVIAGSVNITFTSAGSTFIATDKGDGTFEVDTNIDTGSTIDYNTGVCSLVFKVGHLPTAATKLNASYKYNQLVQGGNIPEVTAQLTSKFLTAQRRAVNLKYIFDSALLMSKEHGVDLEAELLEKGTAGMMNEIAISAARDIYNAAPGGADEIVFDKTPPSTQIPYIIHRQELIGRLADGSLTIEQKIRYAKANFVIGGREFTSLCRGLPKDVFQKANYDVNPTGMHVVGMLDDQWEVIQNLDYKTNEFTLGAMGPDFLHSGSIYAEFIPLTVLNANWLSDADIFRTAIQWSAFTVVNPEFYVKGKITAS